MNLLQNREWVNVTGFHGQGQKQHGKLSADAFNALSASLHGGIPKRGDSSAFLGDIFASQLPRHITLISPLFDSADTGEHDVDGSLVQLIPEPDLYNCGGIKTESSFSGLWRLKKPESGCD